MNTQDSDSVENQCFSTKWSFPTLGLTKFVEGMSQGMNRVEFGRSKSSLLWWKIGVLYAISLGRHARLSERVLHASLGSKKALAFLSIVVALPPPVFGSSLSVRAIAW